MYSGCFGRRVFAFLRALHGIGVFVLITPGMLLRNFRVAQSVIRPLIACEIYRAGMQLLPMFLFTTVALGFLVIGQTVSWLNRIEAANYYLGSIMVIVVVRELGSLLTSLLVQARVGTANIVDSARHGRWGRSKRWRR